MPRGPSCLHIVIVNCGTREVCRVKLACSLHQNIIANPPIALRVLKPLRSVRRFRNTTLHCITVCALAKPYVRSERALLVSHGSR